MTVEEVCSGISKKITNNQRDFLLEKGLKWCPVCRNALEFSLFSSPSSRLCRECLKKKTRIGYEKGDKAKMLKANRDWRKNNLERARKRDLEWKSKNKEKCSFWSKRYRENNPDKVKNFPSQSKEAKSKRAKKLVENDPDYNRKKYLKIKDYYKNNPHKKEIQNKRRKERRREADAIYFQKYPEARIAKRLREIVRRVKTKEKDKPALFYTGVNTHKEFILKMNEKAPENWLSDGWHLDHIWQINWFDLNSHEWEEICCVINNHKNLIPKLPSENLSRDKLSFNEIKWDDFPEYEKYLKPHIAEKIKIFFDQKV